MKIIFLDIDGTLVEGGKNVPPDSAVEAIKAARAKGNKVFLCSGRNKSMLSPLLKFGFDGYIASAGGYIVCDDEVIFDHPMTEEEYDTAIRILREVGAVCTVECRDNVYGDSNMEGLIRRIEEKAIKEGRDIEASGNSELKRWRATLSEDLGIKPMDEFEGEPVYKIVMLTEDKDTLHGLARALADNYHVVFMAQPVGDCANGELTNNAFDKGRGVIRVCEHYGVDVKDSIGFGDSENDIEMIETVGTSVCMANGSDTVKEMSDYVAPAVSENGLAEMFKKLDLC